MQCHVGRDIQLEPNLNLRKAYLNLVGWTAFWKNCIPPEFMSFLATPSGARPAWMSQAYPQVLRWGAIGYQPLHGGRHNHCMSSPVYRENFKINSLLAERYAQHPAVLGWHISMNMAGIATVNVSGAVPRLAESALSNAG